MHPRPELQSACVRGPCAIVSPTQGIRLIAHSKIRKSLRLQAAVAPNLTHPICAVWSDVCLWESKSMPSPCLFSVHFEATSQCRIRFGVLGLQPKAGHHETHFPSTAAKGSLLGNCRSARSAAPPQSKQHRAYREKKEGPGC